MNPNNQNQNFGATSEEGDFEIVSLIDMTNQVVMKFKQSMGVYQ